MKFTWKESAPKKPELSGTFVAWAYEVRDIGTHRVQYKRKDKETGKEYLQNADVRKMIVFFEVPSKKDSEGRTLTYHRWYDQELGEKARLTLDLSAAHGRKITREDVEDVLSLIFEKPYSITLVQNGEYTDISTVAGVGEDTVVRPRTRQLKGFSLEDFDAAYFADLPGWIQAQIKKSVEYQRLTDGHMTEDEPDPRAYQAPKRQVERDLDEVEAAPVGRRRGDLPF